MNQYETLDSLIIKWFQENVPCGKLRTRLMGYTLFSFVINIYMLITAYNKNAILLFPALLEWILLSCMSTYLVYKQIVSSIAGNLYKEFQMEPWQRNLRIAIALFILYLLQKIKFSDLFYYSFMAIPITLSFFIASITALIWLINYESKNGDVFVMKMKRGSVKNHD